MLRVATCVSLLSIIARSLPYLLQYCLASCHDALGEEEAKKKHLELTDTHPGKQCLQPSSVGQSKWTQITTKDTISFSVRRC